MGLGIIAAVVIAVLKVLGVITISWWWVPGALAIGFLATIAFYFVILVILAICAAVGMNVTFKKRR